MLIIEIDGMFHQSFITGKKCSKSKIRTMYLKAQELTDDIGELSQVFCRLYHFEQIHITENTLVDFVIDTDTDRIYSPTY